VRVQPWKVHIPDASIAALNSRLQSTTWADETTTSDWSYGVPGSYLRGLVEYWTDGFDWRAQERKINQYAHFRLQVTPDIPVHFLRAPGKGPNPLPLVLTHGWPWTFWDYSRVIGPLSDPAAYGGDPADAFDVVVPSLPGYPFSTPLRAPDVDAATVADIWITLMVEALGFETFAAAGGDWGSIITADLGARYPQHLTGLYLSFPPIRHVDVSRVTADDYSADEQDWPEWNQKCRATMEGHLAVHRNGHQTLAWALSDSPVGLAAWLLERRRNWSDCAGSLDNRYSADFLLTTVSLYWLTNSIGSAMQLYAADHRRNLRQSSAALTRNPRVEAPTGIGVFPKDVVRVPRAACERAVNLHRWALLPEGGHFAPAEVPDIYVEELREFFRPLR
jgi:pimeloyl-ACP methyl ester carboxylesterase